MTNSIIRYLIICLFLFPSVTWGQDVENIGKAKAIKLSGGLNTSASFYAVEGTELNRDPYFWMLNANINFNFFGVVDAPFSLTLTKENQTYNQPSFKQYGISPRYKAVTLHLGYRNMSFSSYSLSGITFFGAGVEIKPKNIPVHFSAMYGRFQEARDYVQFNQFEEGGNQIFEEPSYKRMGFGFKTGYVKKEHSIELIFFRAYDVEGTINYLPDDVDIKPEENLIFGISTKTKILKKLSLNFEFTNSTYTYDKRMPAIEYDTYTYLNNLPWLFTPRVSTSTQNAIVAGITYQLGKVNVGGGYRRVDPGYKSMGTSTVSSDIEDITANISSTLFKDKLNLSANVGKQRNNLENQSPNTMQRLIGSLNCGVKVSDAIDLSMNYSNFNSSTIPISIAIVDSIKYIQSTESLSVGSNISFEKGENKKGVSINADYQKVNSTNSSGTDTLETGSEVYGANLSYSMHLAVFEVDINTAANYSSYQADVGSNETFGPTFGISKSFLEKKMRTNLMYSYFISKSGEEESTPVNNVSINVSYQVNKHHSFRFNTRYMQKVGTENNAIHRFQGTLSYNYTL